MKVLIKITLTPIAFILALIGGLFVGLIALFYAPIDFVISCLCDLWEN